ncbi:MAG: hypothetical protein ACTSXC_02135, partial [Candidatus Freyarchaeota archaeon]
MTLRWVIGLIILSAPVFAFIDVALAECTGGLTTEDLRRLRWLVGDVTIMINHGFVEKVEAVKWRYFPVVAVAVFVAGIIMSESTDPLSTKWENIKDVILISAVLSTAPLGIVFWTPIITSILRIL